MKRRKVAILGAGISGLALGFFLRQRYGSDIDITIIEKSNRVGGWIQTNRQQGFLFEYGPRGCRPRGNGLATLRLIEQLGLEGAVIGSNSLAAKRYIYHNQRFVALPSGPLSLTPWLPMVFKACWSDLRAPRSVQSDESIFAFARRRFGESFAKLLIDPLVAGIYAGDMHLLSVRSCFPLLYEWEQNYGSVLRGLIAGRKQASAGLTPWMRRMQRYSLISFKNGMQTLVDALGEKLKDSIRLSTKVETLQFSPKGIEIAFEGGNSLVCDHVFSALPAHSLPSSIGRTIPYNSITVVCIGYNETVLPKKGFGYLVPKMEGEHILGMVWDSCVFPQQNQTNKETRITVMLRDQKDAIDIARDAISRHLGITKTVDAIAVSSAIDAIPQYRVGHNEIVNEIRQSLDPRLTLLGSAFSGVGVNDCIAAAESLSKQDIQSGHVDEVD